MNLSEWRHDLLQWCNPVSELGLWNRHLLIVHNFIHANLLATWQWYSPIDISILLYLCVCVCVRVLCGRFMNLNVVEVRQLRARKVHQQMIEPWTSLTLVGVAAVELSCLCFFWSFSDELSWHGLFLFPSSVAPLPCSLALSRACRQIRPWPFSSSIEGD